MTKDELDKEAGESWWNDNNCSGALSTKKIYICGFLAGAEPREKRIEELKAQIADLEKENAELKKDKAELCHSINEAGKAYTKLKEENNYLSEQIQELKIELDTPESVVLDKLDEAKEIIRNLLRVTYGEGWNYSLDWKVKAEQFLKENK